jgi:HlyD family secretion protein
MFSGTVIGMYFEPPLLRAFYGLTGLQPGGGAETPIALPPNVELPPPMAETMLPSDVIGLARLMPKGDVSVVPAPYGAGDARIAEILVLVGQTVEKGAVLARLDNASALEGAVLTAEANLAVREAALLQTRAAVQASRDEAQATLNQALAAAADAATGLKRTEELFQRGVATQETLDAVRTAAESARLAVTRAAKIEAAAPPAYRARSAGEIRLETSDAHARALISIAACDVMVPDGRKLFHCPQLWISPGDRVV